ncbi:Zn-dependent alcohol dehydrogenase [Thalassotalea agarivorans]|uniref:S-(Hydroxymethyl)glutathione dehydrogenase / alcohol dehydrogenase n=1 Tax=Thalassotalea agarivorans TaxID=349064 RepID=A0A1I0DZ38_THASX|nr:Zn-dependent alcohol dehydrogenase [Thalassotalea agarivorans]SET38012.1 S-(hydroxymethyl)glutathione dehydrogenase / alcohol dehydrogenase [Thalassotalea agarivorans]
MINAKALVSDGKGNTSLKTVKVAAPGLGEVQVKVIAAGLCHTDWDSIQHWNKSFIVGHEGAGIVSAVGEGVSNIAVGDHVILNWAIPCGECFQCLEGNVHICEVNSPVCGCDLAGHAHAEATTCEDAPLERSFHLGTLCEYTVVKEQAVVKIDKSVPFASAAIVGCGVMTGWGSVVNAANVKAGASVCVIGCGGVGLNAIQGAAQSGAYPIIAIDINQDRIDQAKTYGATHGIIAQKDDKDFVQVKREVHALTNNRGADYAFECTAIPALGSAPLTLIRSAGTAVQVSGIEQRIDFDCELFEWDKIYINPLYGQCNPQRDFPRLLALYANGQLKLDELVTQTYTLETVTQGLEDMLAGKNAKGVVMIQQP